MNTPIHKLQKDLESRFTDASFSMDTPADPNGLWLLDINHAGYAVEATWHPQYGFGISARDAVYGELPDETFEDTEAAFTRIRRLLLSHAPTLAPREVTLAELRRRAEVSQVDLAARLNVSQASVSKTERRADILIGTLRQFVYALGGTLELRARIGDETVRVVIDPSRCSDDL